jgi:hypothetical protein
MKKNLFASIVAAVALAAGAHAQLQITGIGDGPLTGGTPKFLELYASSAIADLSLWDVQNYNNGGLAPTTTFALSGSVAAGTFLYISTEAVNFEVFFGFAPNFTSGALNVNGDDAVALRLSTVITDVYGVIGVDGSGEVWDYLDGSSVRMSFTGPSATFTPSQWTFNGVDSLEGGATNATAPIPFQVGTFQPIPEPGTIALVGLGLIGILYGARRRKA